MAAVPVTIYNATFVTDDGSTQTGTIMGLAVITGLGLGGGPIVPPPVVPPDPSQPHPSHPIALPGDPWWGQDLKPTHPIALPGDPWWPLPPDHPPPAPGSPSTVVPPPAGSPGWPVQPIVPPSSMVVLWPGIGPVEVAPPVTGATTPPPA